MAMFNKKEENKRKLHCENGIYHCDIVSYNMGKF